MALFRNRRGRRGQNSVPSASPAVRKEMDRITAELRQHTSLVTAMLHQSLCGDSNSRWRADMSKGADQLTLDYD